MLRQRHPLPPLRCRPQFIPTPSPSNPHSSHIRNGPSRTHDRPPQHPGADGEKPHGVPGARHPPARPPPRPSRAGGVVAAAGVGVGVGGAVAAAPRSIAGGPPHVDGSSSAPASSPAPTCVSTSADVHAPPRAHGHVTHLRRVHAASGASAGAPGG